MVEIYPITKNIYTNLVKDGISNRKLVLAIKEGITYRRMNDELDGPDRFPLFDTLGVMFFNIKFSDIEIPLSIFNGSGGVYTSSTPYFGFYIEEKYDEYVEKIKEAISNPSNFTIKWTVTRTSETPKYYRKNVIHRVRSIVSECGLDLYPPLLNKIDGDFEVTNKDYPEEIIKFSMNDNRIIFDEMQPTPLDMSIVTEKLKFIKIILNFNPTINYI